MIVSAITSGLTAGGVNIVPVGILPTPAIAYLTKHYAFVALGIMITASHNPKEYNGIKIIGPDGYKLPDQLEEQIEDLISKIDPDTVAEYYGYSSVAAEFVRVYFCFILILGGIIGMSFINSIFVDAMVADNNNELEEQVKELNAKIDRLLEQQEKQ
jgi:phosphoglucosamine mutase